MTPSTAAPSTAAPSTPSHHHHHRPPASAYDLLTCTITAPPFAYAHLELVTDAPPGPDDAVAVALDALVVKAYCAAALRQFLGLTGAAVAVDILKAEGRHCWVRVPRPDLAAFAAAITAWQGTADGAALCLLRLKQCSDWLAPMVGADGQDRLWKGCTQV